MFSDLNGDAPRYSPPPPLGPAWREHPSYYVTAEDLWWEALLEAQSDVCKTPGDDCDACEAVRAQWCAEDDEDVSFDARVRGEEA